MKFEIIGSGGCVSLPKPLCKCHVCQEARDKGRPYSRFGPSIFLHDEKLLIDTPEDICHAINASSIDEIKHVAFSHMDPDHVLGFRVFEQLRLNWLELSEGRACKQPINVYALPNVMKDLNQIYSAYGSYLDYYEKVRNLIKREPTKEINFNHIKLDFIAVGRATIFVFQEADKKFIYAPCDVKPLVEDDRLHKADVMVIGNTMVGEVLKDGIVLSKDNFIREELFNMEEIKEIKEKLNIKKVIITHLEEDWGKSYDDYKALEASYDGIYFAYDGMIIEV